MASLWIKKIIGKDNIPKDQKGFIVAANHASYLDHFILGGTIALNTDRMVYFLAKKEHFDTFFQRQWHKFLKAIPIDRQAGGEEGLKHAIKALKEGKIIAIYPEGTRTLTGKLNQPKTGITRLALAAQVPVLPVGIQDTFSILPKGRWFPKFKKTNVKIGKLMYFDKYHNRDIDYKTLKLLSEQIMKNIERLIK